MTHYYETLGQFLPGSNTGDRFTSLYTLNSNKYRTREFADIDWNESIVVFGCSNVFGSGLEENETLTYNLEQMSGYPVINMGQPGSSPFHALYNQMVLKELQVQPKAVINVWTSTERITYFKNTETIPVGRWSADREEQYLVNLYASWTEELHNPVAYGKVAQRICRLFWKDIPHIEGTYFPQTAKTLGVPNLRRVDASRDGGHPGPRTVYESAKVFHYQLREKLSRDRAVGSSSGS